MSEIKKINVTRIITFISHLVYYSVPDKAAEYCDERVVCVSVSDRIFGTTCPIFTKFCVCVAYGHGSILLW